MTGEGCLMFRQADGRVAAGLVLIRCIAVLI